MNLITPRRQFNSTRWRTRVTLWLAALCAGGTVAAFARLAEWALAEFNALTTGRPWLPFLLAPTIGMATVWLTRRFVPGAQGSGIPQVIAATRLAAQGNPVHTLVSLRIAVGKVVLGVLALLGGFSAGREGPSVQVAASILHASHRFLPHSRIIRSKDLLIAGGAAGIAAAFNTPLAGIVFAIEELGRRLESRTSGILVTTIIIAGLVAISLLGNYNYFGHLKITTIDTSIVVSILVGGVVTGVLGGGFSWLMLWPLQRKDSSVMQWRGQHPILFAGGCGLAVALLGLISHGASFGSGYAITAQVVAGQVQLPWYVPITRFLATLASYFSGIPGGIFAPALAIGAGLGSTLAQLQSGVDAIPLIALCMAGFLAAVTQSPITSAIIVMEMIDGHQMVISLMAIALLAKVVSSRISPELYQKLALGWMPHSQDSKHSH